MDSGIGSADGLIEIGERWRQQIIAWHLFTRERDRGPIAICLVGNFELPGKTPSPAQLRAVVALTRALMARFDIRAGALTTHAGIDGRLNRCPGKNFPRARIRDASSTTGAAPARATGCRKIRPPAR